jgi:arginine N-succinyltransferase
MMIIRHVQAHDLEDVLRLAEQSGVGMTSLPADRNTLKARIERTQNTLHAELDPSEQGYLFVLEDSQSQRVVGLSGIEVAVGLKEPFYSFRIGQQVHASHTLEVYKSLKTLFLSNDLTGSSELCTLFLDADYRKDQNGKFLSKVRFLFMAAFQQYFQDKVIAEMRGYSDEHGHSPFWDALGHQFFNTDFAKADYLSGVGHKAFIAELMPRFPVYIDLLPQTAQAVIAKVHPQTYPAYCVLENEGMKSQGYVDIFDGGPTLEAQLKDLRAVQQSRLLQVEIQADVATCTEDYLVANQSYQDYRAILIRNVQTTDRLALTAAQADSLGVAAGDQVRILALNSREKAAC